MAKINYYPKMKGSHKSQYPRSYWNRHILITENLLSTVEDNPRVQIGCNYSYTAARRNFQLFATLCGNESKLGRPISRRRELYRAMFGIRSLYFQRKMEIARVIIGPLPRRKKVGKRNSTGMTSSESSDSDRAWDSAFGNYIYSDRSSTLDAEESS